MNYDNTLKDVKCTKCGEKAIYIELPPKEEKKDTTKTLDEFVNDLYAPVTLAYKMTTYTCKNCGYSVSR